MRDAGWIVQRALPDEHEVSDVFDLSPGAIATLATLPVDIRSMVEDEMAQLFRAMLEFAYHCGRGMPQELIQSTLPPSLKSLIACEFSGELAVRYPMALFWVAKERTDPRVWITNILLNHSRAVEDVAPLRV